MHLSYNTRATDKKEKLLSNRSLPTYSTNTQRLIGPEIIQKDNVHWKINMILHLFEFFFD